MPLTGRELALHVENRKVRKSPAPWLTLFRLGRITTLVILLGIFAYCASHGLVAIGTSSSFLTVFAVLVALPLLLGCVLLCARTGMHGIAEYICGLSHYPMGLLGANDQHKNYHLVALIYSGMGRLEEAHKFFRIGQSTHNIYDSQFGTPFNLRNRLPELLARMGKLDQAKAMAQADVEQARKDLKDIVCPTAIIHLQVTLLTYASVLHDCGEDPAPYLDEAAKLIDSPDFAAASETVAAAARESAAPAANLPIIEAIARRPDEAKTLAYYARGWFHLHQGRYQEAIPFFERCRDAILASRGRGLANAKNNSELLGFNQRLLGICLEKTGNAGALEDAVKILHSENHIEPPASTDKVYLDLTQAKLEVARGNPEAAIEILESAIEAMSRGTSSYDGLLATALKQYQETLETVGRHQDASAAKSALAHLDRQLQIVREETEPLRLPQLPARLPDINTTKSQANRSAALFIMLAAYVAYRFFTNPAEVMSGGWISILFFAFLISAKVVYDHVQNRKVTFTAAQALQQGNAVDVTLKPIEARLKHVPLLKCRIEEGPENLVGQEIELRVNNNLFYASAASRDGIEASVRGRVYQDSATGKVLAIETLGRVLTIQKTLTRTKATKNV